MLAMATAYAEAAEYRAVRILTGEENPFVQKTASLLADALKQADPQLEVDVASPKVAAEAGGGEAGKRLIVLLGESAFSSADTGNEPVLALVPHRATATDRKRAIFSTLYFEQPLSRLLNLASLLVHGQGGKDPIIGIVVSPAVRPVVSSAEALARDRKLGMHIETVQSEAEVGRGIAKAVEDSSLLIAIPDAIVHTPNTVQSVLLVSYHAGVPVLGYSAAYLRAGAAVALYSTPEQLARQAADMIAGFRANKLSPGAQWPTRYTVAVNATVLRSLSVSVPAADILEKKLATMKE